MQVGELEKREVKASEELVGLRSEVMLNTLSPICPQNLNWHDYI